jgi:hypothetical protein
MTARKLAAILVADVVGYSRLAGVDEEGVPARLRALRSDLTAPTICDPPRPSVQADSERGYDGMRQPGTPEG